VTPTSSFTHPANAQGPTVIQRIAFPFLPFIKNEPLFTKATFSDAEVATVGLALQQSLGHEQTEVATSFIKIH
jgi:pyruvate/2-oxoglutarate dehydrogenase complex dihydrolipoamide dehydrogenase (E3) component